jgi:predicted permease
MGHLSFDIRDAWRSLRRDRAYAAAVILTLALTIGATTAIFSIVDAVLLRPLAYRESQQLVVVQEVVPELVRVSPSWPVNPRHFAVWRSRATSFENLAEFQTLPLTLTGTGEPAQLRVVLSTGNLFDVLASSAALGRTLRVQDEAKSGEQVIVLTDHLWRQRFGADPGVIGRAAILDGVPRTIVGVLGRTFQFPVGEGLDRLVAAPAPDAFVPLRIDPEGFSANGEYNYSVLGRLKAGVAVAQGAAELDVLQADVAATITHRPGLKARVQPLMDAVVGRARQGLLLLLGAIAAVLLIACANLANLSLTRSLSRVRDAAVRASLGASRGRLVSHVIGEQVLLAAVGGALGLAVARALLAAFVRTAPIDLPRVAEVGLNGRVLSLAAVLSFTAGLLVSMLPAWRLAGRDVQQTLRSSGPSTTSDRGGLRARAVLLAAQVTLSVTLLVVTALLAMSFGRMLRVDRGFVAEHVLAADVTLPGARYTPTNGLERAYERILAGVRALPGVDHAAWISNLPLTGESWGDAIHPIDQPEASREMPLANYRFVAPDFFETLSIPVMRGRSLMPGDLDASRATTAAVISKRTAERMWPGVDPIGRRFTRSSGAADKPFEVVGVCADSYPVRLDVPPPMTVYVPYSYRSRSRAALVIRSAGDPSALTNAVRQAIWHVDPEIAIANARPMDQIVDAAIGGRRYQMTIFITFAAVALLIAVLGVYAVTAYGVSRRRREMNIRLALGAKPSQVVALVVRQGFAPVAAGLFGGVGGALAVGSAVASLLFDVRARDPIVIASTAVIVGAIGLAACLLAARQGLGLNPAAALREE